MENAKGAAIKYSAVFGVAFILGMLAGEFTYYKHVIDDCRILQATRIGEKVIKCTTN